MKWFDTKAIYESPGIRPFFYLIVLFWYKSLLIKIDTKTLVYFSIWPKIDIMLIIERLSLCDSFRGANV